MIAACAVDGGQAGGMGMRRMFSRAWAGLKRAGGWLARVFTPSAPAWSAAAYALLALWAFMALSFLFHDVLPQLSLGKLLGLIVVFSVLALLSVGVLLLVRVLAMLKLRYRFA